MEADTKSSGTRKLVLSDPELGALISLAGLRVDKTSPIAQVKTGTAADTRKLQQSSLLADNGRPTADCLELLGILANPDVELNLLWGNPESVSLSKVYYTARSGKLVSFTRANGSSNISYFLSFQDITGLIAEKTAFPPVKEAAAVSFEAATAALPVFLSAVDLYRESQLKAALERRQETDVAVTADEVNRVCQESKMETGYSWYAPAGFLTMADVLFISPASIQEGLNALKRESILTSEGTLGGQGLVFANSAFPLMSFFGIKAVSKQGQVADKTQITIFRGLASLLFVQISTEAGMERVAVKSINTSQLPEILFNLVTKPFEIKVAPETPVSPVKDPAPAAVICSKCQESNSSQAKFCKKCGNILTSAPAAKFCPRCGDPVKITEKFCDKCGYKLV